MKTIRIGRLDLKCRGVQSAVARGALPELSAALVRQLSGPDSAGATDPGARSTPAGLADSVAARVAARVRARIASGGEAHPS